MCKSSSSSELLKCGIHLALSYVKYVRFINIKRSITKKIITFCKVSENSLVRCEVHRQFAYMIGARVLVDLCSLCYVKVIK